MMFSIEAEQAVLGGMLMQNEALDMAPWLEPDHFYRAEHRAIFSEARKLHIGGKNFDVVTLGDKLSVEGGIGYLHELASNTPGVANFAHYAGIVRDYAQRRALAVLADEIKTQAANNEEPRKVTDFLQSKLEKIIQDATTSDPVRAGDDVGRYVSDFKRRATGEGPKAMSTGYVDLDSRLGGGLREGGLVVLAGRPKMGKTSLALNFTLNMGFNHGGLFLSMEMPKDELIDRSMSILSGVPLRKIIDPREMSQTDWAKFHDAAERFGQLNLSLDDQGALSLMDVRAKARLVKRKQGLKFIVIDYLQLMEGEGDSRNTQIENITRGLKSLAKELGVVIILLSQLNRQLEQRPNKRPMPSDLRDSGAIEQDCDIAMFVYRDEVYNEHSPDKGICEVIISLIRQGEPGTVGMAYIAYLTKFANLEHGREFGRAPTRQRYATIKD
ncbi:MAG: replicative DNA helicase [Pusillimonas sp.]|nr:replicative DNA helicase [Pusillimonas sp.]